MDIRIVSGRARSNGPVEYKCEECKQLRLSFVAEINKCSNCGSNQIKIGAIGSLKKEN